MSTNILTSKTRTYRIVVGTAALELCKSNSSRKGITVRVTGSDVAYIISAQNLPYTDGIPITATAPYYNTSTTANLWIITSASTVNTQVQDDTE